MRALVARTSGAPGAHADDAVRAQYYIAKFPAPKTIQAGTANTSRNCLRKMAIMARYTIMRCKGDPDHEQDLLDLLPGLHRTMDTDCAAVRMRTTEMWVAAFSVLGSRCAACPATACLALWRRPATWHALTRSGPRCSTSGGSLVCTRMPQHVRRLWQWCCACAVVGWRCRARTCDVWERSQTGEACGGRGGGVVMRVILMVWLWHAGCNRTWSRCRHRKSVSSICT